MCAFHGQMGMFVRALAYMLSHGADGLRQASEDAVLNANYVRASLADLMSPAFGDRPCMHEALFDDRWLEGTDIATLDFAKAMIDEGFHPMTVYFPLVVHGAMLIEPTEFGIQAEPRRLHRLPARPGRRRQVRRHRPLQGRPALRPAPPPRRDQGRARAAAALDPVSATRMLPSNGYAAASVSQQAWRYAVTYVPAMLETRRSRLALFRVQLSAFLYSVSVSKRT